MEFCCESLKSKIEQESNEYILYLPQTRSFLIKGPGYNAVDISYCPWCGYRLPEDLTDELVNIIYKQLKLKSYDDPKLPEQFKSDKWWKRAGL